MRVHTVALKNNVRKQVITITKTTMGKKFEQVFRTSLDKVQNISIDRLPDQVTKFKGSTNPSDFIVYKYPRQYYMECKSSSCTSLSFDNITQWNDLLEKSKITGVVAGVVIWFYNKDVTVFLDIRLLECMRQEGYKSVSYDLHWATDEKISNWSNYYCELYGEKRRVYYDYDMEKFFKSLEDIYGGEF